MRRTFLIWLSAVICITFLVTGTLVYSQFTLHAHERVEQMLSTRLNDMMELFLHTERSTSYMSRINDASTLDRARALSEIVSLNPKLLKNQEDLQAVCNMLSAEQIAISDENGTIIAAVPKTYVGHNLAESEETRPFLACISSPGYELCIRSSSSEADEQAMQYAGVHRLDAPGVVRLGFRTNLEQAARESDSISRLGSSLRLGNTGRVFVFRRGALLTNVDTSTPEADLLSITANKVHEITINEIDYYAYAVDSDPGDGIRLVGAIPVESVQRSSIRSVQMLLISNFIMFIIMFAVVSHLLQRLVVRGISRVNESLREITEGNLEKRVEVDSSPEFIRLSNGINFMVESLKSFGEEQRQRIERDLELARTIQNASLPNRFPAFPNINEFNLYATCLQARVVGGDFYDFFMPDDSHLNFLVADVDASGVPAALFMMRAMSTIRTLAGVGTAPIDLVKEANNELCQGNQAGISMALFYGSLNIRTGTLDYVNAGGVHALLKRRGGKYEMVPGFTSTLIGEQVGANFFTASMSMYAEDRIFLYTEGVTHAVNHKNTPFGEGRLQDILSQPASTVTDVLQLVRASLRQYVGDSNFKKDISMLCLEYRGDMDEWETDIITADAVQQADELIASRMEELLISPVDIEAVQKSVQVLLATLSGETEVTMQFKCTEDLAEMHLIWGAPEYNPLPHITDLPVNRVTFSYNDGKGNEITFWKNLT